jgi:hypothetical protein
MAIALLPARYVTIELAAAVTGYSVEAIETKIKRGVWVEGLEWKHAPDGRRLIDLRGVEQWVEGRSLAGSSRKGAKSASTSAIVAND